MDNRKCICGGLCSVVHSDCRRCDLKWFKHDATANMDAKLQDVMLEYGMEGYGLYWYCLELIAANVTPTNITFELEHDSRVIARNTGLGVQKVQEIMSHFIKLGLFENTSGIVTCIKLANRTDDYVSRINRIPKSEQSTNIVRTKSEKVPLEQNRLEENRIEQNTKKGYVSQNKPSIKDIREYVAETNSTVDPVYFFNYYESNGWKVGRNPMKDWKATIRTWNKRASEGMK